MSHEYALKIEELNRELKQVRDDYDKLKLKTTKNLHKGLELKRRMSSIDTEIGIQRTLYFKYLESLRKITKFKGDV